MTGARWSLPAIGERVLDIVADVSDVDRATIRPTLLLQDDLGLDDLAILEVLVLAEEAFAISIPTASLAFTCSSADVVESVRAALDDPPPPMVRPAPRRRLLRLRWR